MYLEEKLNELETKVDKINGLLYINNQKEEFVTPQELAKRFQCSQNHIYSLIRKGEIKTVENLGDLKRIPMSQFSSIIHKEKRQ